VQNLRGAPVRSGIYDGSPLQLPLRELHAEPPIGATGVTHTGPGFAVFLVLPVSRDSHASDVR
jgi:hypothetical protein